MHLPATEETAQGESTASYIAEETVRKASTASGFAIVIFNSDISVREILGMAQTW